MDNEPCPSSFPIYKNTEGWECRFRKRLSAPLDALLRPEAASQPYLVVAYADAKSHIQDYAAALSALDEWLSSNEKQESASSDQQWAGARARFAQVLFTEELIRSSSPTPALRREHLRNIRKLIQSHERIGFSAALIAASQRQSAELVKNNFRYSAKQGASCGFNDRFRQALIRNFLNMKLMRAYNGLRDAELWRDERVLLKTQVKEVVDG